jgi:hypothetical protein
MNTLYNKLITDSKVEERLTAHIASREHWIKEAMNQENHECTQHVCGIQALIKTQDIKMCAIEKLIYKAISNNKKELLPKYKEKYMDSTSASLEYWETLTAIGAENEGKYLERANILKENYNYIEETASCLD